MPEISFNPNRTALLSMDFQTSIVYLYLKDPELMNHAASALAAARKAGMLVIHVKVGFRPNLPEISDRNRLFRAIKASKQHQEIFQGKAGEIHPTVAPLPDDIVITKHRVSAFEGTDLDLILRANQIERVVLMGIATSGVVLSTLLHACDTDYETAVIKDCSADREPELHGCLIEKLFPTRADVLSADEFAKSLSAVEA